VAVVLTFDTVTTGNNAALVYVDGALQSGTPNKTGVPELSSRTVKFGARDKNGTLQTFYTGKIDDARVYNVGLTAAQVLALFNSVPALPTVTTSAATGVTTSGATLNGTVNPNGLATNAWFEWGTSPTLAAFTSTANQAVGSGTTAQMVSATLSGLTAGTTYYYRAASSNSAGTTKGAILSFSDALPGGFV